MRNPISNELEENYKLIKFYTESKFWFHIKLVSSIKLDK